MIELIVFISLITIPSFIFGFYSQFKSLSLIHRDRGSLNSLGDPDLSIKSEFYRKFQEWSREIDGYIFSQETDIPGVTFLSPVEWAPWMETIWFGNIYDYRSAFFSDVMYSNNKPNREGALLYKDPYKALMIALLYQRYKRFDISSYSLSNATFFNVFGTQTLRLGRYKIPKTDEVILCITDPLTFSETKRYLNSFNLLKWFKSKFFQQKRKRQYILSISKTMKSLLSSDTSIVKQFSGDETSIISNNFFYDSVYLIEYGRMYMAQKSKHLLAGQFLSRLSSVTIPIRSLSESNTNNINIITCNHQFESIMGDTNYQSKHRITFPMNVANSQYILENLFQTIIQYVISNIINPKTSSIELKNNSKKLSKKIIKNNINFMIGGDGRLYNDFAIEIFQRIARGSDFKNIITFPDNLLSTPAANDILKYLKSSSTTTSASSSSSSRSSSSSGSSDNDETIVAVVLTVPDRIGGIRGYFGVDVLYTRKQSTEETTMIEEHVETNYFNRNDWNYILNKMSKQETVKISTSRLNKPLISIQDFLSTCYAMSNNINKRNILKNTSMSKELNIVDQLLFDKLNEAYDLYGIKQYIKKNDIIISIDFLNAPALYAQYKYLWKFLGLDESSLLNTGYTTLESTTSMKTNMKNSQNNDQQTISSLNPAGDFYGICPDANMNSAEDSLNLFSVYIPDKIISCYSDIDDALNNNNADSNNSDSEKVRQEEVENFSTEGCPDIGFIFNSDGSDCSVMLPGIALNHQESRSLLQSSPVADDGIAETVNISRVHNCNDKDGLRVMLSWLNKMKDNGPLNTPIDLIKNVWLSQGKENSLKITLTDIDAKHVITIIKRIQEIITLKNIEINATKNNSTDIISESNNTSSSSSNRMDYSVCKPYWLSATASATSSTQQDVESTSTPISPINNSSSVLLPTTVIDNIDEEDYEDENDDDDDDENSSTLSISTPSITPIVPLPIIFDIDKLQFHKPLMNSHDINISNSSSLETVSAVVTNSSASVTDDIKNLSILYELVEYKDNNLDLVFSATPSVNVSIKIMKTTAMTTIKETTKLSLTILAKSYISPSKISKLLTKPNESRKTTNIANNYVFRQHLKEDFHDVLQALSMTILECQMENYCRDENTYDILSTFQQV